VRESPFTLVLALVNIAVFLWAESVGSTVEGTTLLQFGAMEPTHVWAGEYWRLVTPMFLHVGWIHLAMNTYFGFGLCAAIERALGSRRFLVVYFASGAAAGCGSAFVAWLLQDGRQSAGASGAIFGILGALLAIRYHQLGSWKAFAADPGIRGTAIRIAIWTAIGLTAVHFDNSAHFFGLFAGALATILYVRRARLAWLGYAAALAGLFLAATHPWSPPRGPDAERFATYSMGYITGSWPEAKSSPFIHNEAKGVRFSEKGCKHGVGLSCLVLAEYLEKKGDPDSIARSKELYDRGCAIDPAPCKQIH